MCHIPFLFSRKPYFYFMSKYTFVKSDRLKSKQQIEQLFVDGDSFIEFPLKVVWRWIEATESPRLWHSAPRGKEVAFYDVPC